MVILEKYQLYSRQHIEYYNDKCVTARIHCLWNYLRCFSPKDARINRKMQSMRLLQTFKIEQNKNDLHTDGIFEYKIFQIFKNIDLLDYIINLKHVHYQRWMHSNERRAKPQRSLSNIWIEMITSDCELISIISRLFNCNYQRFI